MKKGQGNEGKEEMEENWGIKELEMAKEKKREQKWKRMKRV